MRDMHFISGPKRYIESVEDAVELVRRSFPSVIRHGSVNAWSFIAGDEIVAEMWGHRTRPGWWIRIAKPKTCIWYYSPQDPEPLLAYLADQIEKTLSAHNYHHQLLNANEQRIRISKSQYAKSPSLHSADNGGYDATTTEILEIIIQHDSINLYTTEKGTATYKLADPDSIQAIIQKTQEFI